MNEVPEIRWSVAFRLVEDLIMHNSICSHVIVALKANTMRLGF